MRNTILAACAVFAVWTPGAGAREADAIPKAAGAEGGLIAVIGCGDPALLTGLRANDAYLVHGLDADPAKVAAAREYVATQGLRGRVTASRLEGGRLPFVDDLVNVLVVTEGNAKISDDEFPRCLAPRGCIVDARGPQLEVTRKPWPPNRDEWTHYLYDASNNAVSRDSVVAPPRGLHWTCGPRYARSHEHFGSVSAMVSADGRLFYVHDDGPISSVFLPPKWELVARDAFSGVLLWKRPVENWESPLRGFRSGPPEIGRRMVFGDGRLHVALAYGEPVSSLDPATGETASVLAGSEGARELLCAEGTLYVLADDMTAEDHEERKRWFNQRAPALKGYRFPEEPIPMYGKQRIIAFDAESGRQLWCNENRRPAGEIMPATIAVSEGRLCFQTTADVVCLDAESGEETWRSKRPVAVSRFSWATPTLVIHDGVVITGDRMPSDNVGDKPEEGSKWIMDNHHQTKEQPGEIVAFSLQDGKQLWRAPAFENYTVPMDVFVMDDVVWSGHIRAKGHPGFTKGYDLKTGKVTAEIPNNRELYDLQMGHNRCYRNKATCRFIILGRDGLEFIDPERGTGSGHWWVRGTCQYGIMPSGGMVYVPVHSCACHVEEKLNGFNTLAPASSTPAEAAVAPGRLEKGPAYGARIGKPVSKSADWPTYRCDARRSGYQDVEAPRDPRPAWSVECSSPLTAPVCADATVYVAETDRHTVRAIDAERGEDKWTFLADGRVDSPPTICGGLCLFGTRNGFVYCLRAEDGAVVWRFRAAPSSRRLFAYEQLESVWPVHGSVLVDDGASGSASVVYFAAGRTSHLDGGIRLYALDVETGRELHRTTMTTAPGAEGDNVVHARALPDVLSMQNGSVFMRNFRFDRKLAPQKQDVRHLYAPGGFLDDTWWHRTYWIFGTRMMSGYGGWPRIGNVTPAGRLLAFDDGDLIYGYGRMAYRAGAGHVSPDATRDYRLFAELRSPKPKPKGEKTRRGPQGRREFQWSGNLSFVARAMVLSSDALLVAGGKGLPGTAADREPGTLQIVSRDDGTRRAACGLPAPPVLDGVALARQGVFVATLDGRLVCLR